MIKIFISGTKDDLVKYRKAAKDICEQQAIQIEVLTMEIFPAIDSGAIEGCLQMVRKADIYIGIFAHRYGFIPPDETRSITEMEYDEATRIGIPRLCFVVNKKHAWPPEYIENENADKLKTFKDRIDRELTRRDFTTLPNFRKHFLNSLKEHLSNYITSDTKAKSFRSSPIDFPDEPRLVIGRNDELHEIKELFSIDKLSRIIIQGWPGVGKTTLVKKIAYDKDIQDIFPDGIIWLDIGQKANIGNELIRLANRVNAFVKQKAELTDIKEAIIEKIQSLRILLIVDDVWNADDGKWFNVTGKDSRLLYTTRLPKVVDGLRETRKEIYPLRPLSVQESREFLQHPEMAPMFCKKHRGKVKTVVRELEGLPLALKVAAGLLENTVRRHFPVDDVLKNLNKSILDEQSTSERIDKTTGITLSLNNVIRQSTEMLDADAQTCFAMLSMLKPKPATFSLEYIAALWQINNPTSVMSRLIDWGLIEPTSNQRYQMHAVVMMHAQRLYEEFSRES